MSITIGEKSKYAWGKAINQKMYDPDFAVVTGNSDSLNKSKRGKGNIHSRNVMNCMSDVLCGGPDMLNVTSDAWSSFFCESETGNCNTLEHLFDMAKRAYFVQLTGQNPDNKTETFPRFMEVLLNVGIESKAVSANDIMIALKQQMPKLQATLTDGKLSVEYDETYQAESQTEPASTDDSGRSPQVGQGRAH